MKRNLLSFVMIILSFTGSACTVNGSGKVISETRTLTDFSGLDLRNSANVYVTQGNVQEVKIEAEDNIIPLIQTDIRNGQLIITSRDKFNPAMPVNIYITVKDLSLIELSGSGNIITPGEFHCDHINMRLMGSGDIRMTLDAGALKATVSGSGNINLSGRSLESDIRISGSGDVRAEGMRTFMSSVSITGTGNTRVDVNDELYVNITGSGNVYYVTEPGKLSTRIAGSGEVLKI